MCLPYVILLIPLLEQTLPVTLRLFRTSIYSAGSLILSILLDIQTESDIYIFNEHPSETLY